MAYIVPILFTLAAIASFVVAVMCIIGKGHFFMGKNAPYIKEKTYLRFMAAIASISAIMFIASAVWVFTIGSYALWLLFLTYTVISSGHTYAQKNKRFRIDPAIDIEARELTDKELRTLGFSLVAYYFLLPLFLLFFVFTG